MRTRSTTIAATLVLSLLAVACNRSDQSPTAAAPTENRQATAQDRMMESSPPAAGSIQQQPSGTSPETPSSTSPSSPSTSSTPSANDTSSSTEKSPASTGNY